MTGATGVSTVVNLTKTVIGAGILALPFAYRAQGIILATFMIIFSGFLTGVGLLFQTYCSGFLPKGHSSFFNVAKITYPSLATVFDVAIAIKTFGVSVSYLVIIGNLSPQIAGYFGASGIALSRPLWLLLTMVVVSPLSFLRTLDALKYTSIVALASAAYLIVFVLVHYILGDTADARGPISIVEPKGIASVLQTLPIIVLAFTCAHNMFSALNEVIDDSVPHVLSIVVSALGLSAVLYLLLGLTGYLSFGDNVADNIISMYNPSILSTLGRAAIVVLVLFSFPVQLHPSRASILNVWSALAHRDTVAAAGVGVARRAPDGAAGTAQAENIGPGEMPLDNETTPLVDGTVHHGSTPLTDPLKSGINNTVFNGVTTALLIMSFVIAVSVESLELVLSFVGSSGATAVSFILPSIFAYSLSQSNLDNRLVTLRPAQKRAIKYASVVVFVLGILILVLCLGSNIARLL